MSTEPFTPVDRDAARRRAAIIEALAAALVEDYLDEQQQLAKAADDSPPGDAREARCTERGLALQPDVHRRSKHAGATPRAVRRRRRRTPVLP